MKYFFASDLHGSADFTRKMLDRFRAGEAEKLILLGDLLYHGPRNDLPQGYAPKEVIPMLNGCKGSVIAVRGNCDAEVDQMVLDFPIMADYAVLVLNGITFYAVHGHRLSELPSLPKGAAVVYGHIHIPVADEKDGVFMLNPGSVSIPKDGSRNSYAVLDGNVFTIYDLIDGAVIKEISIG